MDIRYFWYILWLIHGRMLQPLDYCANSTRLTLGLVDVYYFLGGLVASSAINTPYPYIFLTQSSPQAL
jgi:hypothetical protein